MKAYVCRCVFRLPQELEKVEKVENCEKYILGN